MTVLKPPQFNERFTIYVNAEGKPVERTLREMTADEVLAAMDWHTALALRLEQEAEPHVAMSVAAVAGTLDPATPDETRTHAVVAMREAAAALENAVRLESLVHAIVPQWREGTQQAVGSFTPAPIMWIYFGYILR